MPTVPAGWSCGEANFHAALARVLFEIFILKSWVPWLRLTTTTVVIVIVILLLRSYGL